MNASTHGGQERIDTQTQQSGSSSRTNRDEDLEQIVDDLEQHVADDREAKGTPEGATSRERKSPADSVDDGPA
jgi:ribosome-binding protein aMBF1 (putative translation factor)